LTGDEKTNYSELKGSNHVEHKCQNFYLLIAMSRTSFFYQTMNVMRTFMVFSDTPAKCWDSILKYVTAPSIHINAKLIDNLPFDATKRMQLRNVVK